MSDASYSSKLSKLDHLKNIKGSVNTSYIYGTPLSQDRLESLILLVEENIESEKRKKDKKFFLKQGERATYEKKSRKVMITEDEVEMNADWENHTVRFSGQTLREVCEVLSHRFDIHVEVAPEVGDQYTYTFTFHDYNIV